MRSNYLEVHQQLPGHGRLFWWIREKQAILTRGRYLRVQCYVGAETFFFAKGDGVADLNLAAGIARHRACRRLATLAAVLLAALAALVGQGDVFFEGLVKPHPASECRSTRSTTSYLRAACELYPGPAAGGDSRLPERAAHPGITSLRTSPEGLLQLVRNRWSIEGWHWTNYTQLHDDAHRYRGNGAGVMASLRTAALNLLRLAGFQSIRSGMRSVMHDIGELMAMARRQPAQQAY